MKVGRYLGIVLLLVVVVALAGIAGIVLMDDGDSDEPALEGDNGADDPNGSDDDENGDTESEEDEEPAVAFAPEVEVSDLGSAETGEMRLYNETTDEQIATHNFENSSGTIFWDVTTDHLYRLEVDVDTAPPEEFTVDLIIEDDQEDEDQVIQGADLEVGDNFQGASSYEEEWVADTESFTYEEGYTVLDGDGNYLVSWENEPERFKNFYDAEEDEWFTNSGVDDWFDSGIDTPVGERTGPSLLGNSLSGVENRTFVEKKDSGEDATHVYRVEPGEFYADHPIIAHIDPETGYVVYADYGSEYREDVSAMERWFSSHNDEDLDAVPDDFPSLPPS